MTVKRIVIESGYGQTCNQLIQIANWIPVAIELGASLHFPEFAKYAADFAGTAGQSTPRFPGSATVLSRWEAFPMRMLQRLSGPSTAFRAIRLIPGHAAFAHDNEREVNPRDVVSMAKASTLWVRGWLFRDVDGRQTHRRAIMDFFAPIPTLAAMASHAIAEGRRNTDVLVGVHLRRGDYRAWSGGRHFYDDATMVRILAQLVKLLAPRRCRFLLASNEAISLESYQSLDVLLAPGHPVGDLYSLAGCDYIIGPPSTYTLWAGWYGESLVHHVTDPQTPLQLSDFG